MLCSWKCTRRRIKELPTDLLPCSLPSKQRSILSRKRRRTMNDFHDWGIGGNLTTTTFNIYVSMQIRIEALVVFNLYFLFFLTTLLATTLLIFLISTHMLCFVESKIEHVCSCECSLPWWFHVRVLNEENWVLWTRFPWTKTESIRLDF